MAAILNMIPVDQKQNTVLQNANIKDYTKNRKLESGFAKALHSETGKSEMDVDAKLKSNDSTQLMVAMAGMVVPLLVNKNLVEQVNCNTADTLGGTESITQAQLRNAVPVIPQTQLRNAVPAMPQAQLENAVPVVSQVQLRNAISVIPQAQSENTVSVIPQAQSENAVPVIPQVQSENAVPVIPQAQSENVVPVVPQVQLGNVVLVVPQIQQANAVSRDIGLSNLLSHRPVVNTQVNNTQFGEFAELQAKTQLEMQNKPILGQVEVTESSIKNTEILTNDPVISNIMPSITMGNTNTLSKNSNKQFEGKRIAVDQSNIEATEILNNFGLIASIDVKAELAPQVAVSVVDKLLSENKENVDASLSHQTVKISDIFGSMLTQQGMKNENQAMVEAKGTSSQQVSDPYNIATQIVDQARLVAGTKNTEMIIQLKPEHLGELTFKVTIENGIVSASFHSNNSEVRSVIESTLSQLKQDLSNQGLKIDTVGVYAGLGQFFSDGQQREGYQQPVIKVQNKKTEDDFLEVFETTSSAEGVLHTPGVDYRA